VLLVGGKGLAIVVVYNLYLLAEVAEGQLNLSWEI
jgi:hypothetical protein